MSNSDVNRILRTLRREPTDRVPNWEIAIDPRNVNAMLGREGLPASLSLDPESLVELGRRTGMDAVGFGLFWSPGRLHERSSDGTSRYVGGSIKTRAEVEKLQPPAPESFAPILQKLDRVIALGAKDNIGCWVYTHGPFDLCYLGMGYEDFMYALCDDRALVERLMDLFTEVSRGIVRTLVAHGVSFVVFADDVAQKGGLMIRPEMFRELWLARARKVIEPAISAGVPVVMHSDGFVEQLAPWLVDLGISGLHPLEPCGGNDIYRVKEQWGARLCLIGNMDIAGRLSFGSPKEVREDTGEHLRRLSDGGGYVVCSSHSVIDSVPPENYRAMIETAWTSGAVG